MKRFLPVLLLVLVLCWSAGCASAPPVPAGPAVPAAVAVSITATPVQYADVNGVRLAYREWGSGEPLLVIVGFGVTMEQANETAIGIFASKYHVILYDHRGMGQSSAGNASPSIGLYADDAAGLVQALGYGSMHVYGTSMGSFIAQELALSHPGTVRKMILDSPSYSIRVPEIHTLKAYLESVAADPASPPGLRDEAHAILAWNGTEERLPRMQKDIMLVVGTEDSITPEVLSVRMAEKINGSWLVRFRGLPHAGGGVAPEEYGRIALHFLATNESFGQ
jgi:pimeloyl-ACP methyl ester carboxylesterase